MIQVVQVVQVPQIPLKGSQMVKRQLSGTGGDPKIVWPYPCCYCNPLTAAKACFLKIDPWGRLEKTPGNVSGSSCLIR